MTDAVISTMGWVVSNYLIGGVEPGQHGNENTTSAPSGTFRASDGALNIAANKDEQWQALARHLDREELLSDPRFATREDRKANRIALRDELETVLTTRPAEEWVRELSRLGVPAGPVLNVPQILAAEQTAGRGLVSEQALPDGRPIGVVASPVVMDGARVAPGAPPPALGGDNAEIWGALGLDAAARAELHGKGVI